MNQSGEADVERENAEHAEARRKFLITAGKFAAITPPLITGLLTVSKGNYAMALSGSGPQGNNGFGNGGGDGVPGNSAGKGGGKGKGPISDNGR